MRASGERSLSVMLLATTFEPPSRATLPRMSSSSSLSSSSSPYPPNTSPAAAAAEDDEEEEEEECAGCREEEDPADEDCGAELWRAAVCRRPPRMRSGLHGCERGTSLGTPPGDDGL
jgi:hypothetical protein